MSIYIAPIHETSLRHSGTAHIVKGYHSFTCTPCILSASGTSHTCLCLLIRSWYSFTDPGGMEGRVDLGARLPRTCNLPIRSPALYHTATSAPPVQNGPFFGSPCVNVCVCVCCPAYHCAYVSDILLQGFLYVTHNWFCFYSKLLGKKRVSHSAWPYFRQLEVYWCR